MGKNHCWQFFGRIVCAAIAIAFAVNAYCVFPASAAEDTVQAAQTDDNSFIGPRSLSIADESAPLGDAEPLAVIEPAAGMVDRDFVLPESDEIFDLVLSVERKGNIITSAILGLQQGFNYYVPLYELSRLLNFPVELDLAEGRISGSFFNVQNTFSLDAEAGTYTVLGETAALPENSVIVRNLGQGIGDIYVTQEVLNRLWALDIEIDFSRLSINIDTPRKLPYELEEERKRMQGLLDKSGEPVLDLVHVPSGYRTLGPHVLNLSENLVWDGEGEEPTNAFTVTGRGDLLGASADYTVNWLADGLQRPDIQNLRMKLTRRDYGDGKLLPFGLKLLQVGDVSAKPSPLVSNNLFGRGVFFSSETNERRKTFDEISITGTAQPGWEVELYRGRTLLDFGTVNEIGQYRFDSVLLNYGDNEFRIVLYGPQGQVEERFETYDVENEFLAAGQTTIEGGAVSLGEPFFDVRDRGRFRSQGNAQYLRVNHGISHWLGGFATATKVPGREGENRYLSLGMNLNLLGGAGQVEGYKQMDGGTALDLRYGNRILGFNTNFRTSFFNNFESNEAGFDDNAKTSESEARISRGFVLPFADLNLGFSTRHTEYVDRPARTQFTSSQGAGIGRYSVSNNVTANLLDGERQTTQGLVAFNTPLVDRWGLRTSLYYDIFPEKQLDYSQVSLSYSPDDKFYTALTVQQGIEDTNRTSFDLSTSYDFGTFLGGAELGWARGEGFDFILRANTTLGPDGESGEYVATTDYKGFTTALKVRLYEDLDYDGVFSEGDLPVEGVRVRLNQRRSQPSDADGFIEMLGAGRPGFTQVVLERKGMPNPFLVPVKDGYSVILREGTKPFINFPLYQTGSIDGTVRFADGRPIPGVTVELLSGKGTVLDSQVTQFDGFYVFEFVKPGTYTVRLAPSQQVNVPPQTVAVTSDDLFAYGVDLILLEQATEVSVPDDSVVRDGGRVAQRLAPEADGTLKPAPTSSDSPFDTAVRAVRIGEHPYRVRLVLDLSAPAAYTINAEEDGRIINIDLPGVAWDAAQTLPMADHPIFQNFEVFALPGDAGTRVRLTSRERARIFYNSTIPAENGLPDRMYVDFLKQK